MADSYGESSLCTTPACIHIASEILGNFALNYTEIDPCTDFDQCKLPPTDPICLATLTWSI
jgi:endothelin-converting enzyme